MAVQTLIARRFLTALSRSGTLDQYMALGKIEPLFKNVDKEDFQRYDKHVRSHAALPSPDLLEQWWDDLPKTPEPASYYHSLLKNRHFESSLTKIVENANKFIQDDEAEKAAVHIAEQLLPMLMQRHGNRLITLGDAYSLVQTNYFQQMKLGDEYGIRMGYPVVDDYGGLTGGDVLSLVGRPAAGKSFLVLRSAHHTWKNQHKIPAFLSMEMNNLISGQRLVAMDAGIPLSGLKLQKGQGLTTNQLKKLKESSDLAKKAANPFHLMDGNLSTTVEDIFNFCRQMKPDVLFIDGAYMLKHPNPRLGRFERVAENCELIKQEIAGNLGIPVVASWQFSRDAAKKMKSNKKGHGAQVDLEDIGYSDAIGQISSIVLALLDEETVETMLRKRVTIMKGRSGETGEFFINWRFNPTMNFDLWQEQQVGEMSFL